MIPHRLITTLATAAPLATAAWAAQHDSPADLPPILTPEDLSNLGNSSLFTRWRPRSHFLAPHSWMNDPCGPLYDPNTDTYHLHYQFNPNHVNWGNISWGHAVSKDLFHWTDVRDWANDSAVSLAPGKYASAPLSQFTGTTQPVNLFGDRDGSLLTFGTGIHHLPTNWKIPYTEGTEVQNLFISHDGGETWDELGTAIAGPPEGWNVTGWRDPSFFPSPELDALTASEEPRYYMVLGSGLKGDDVPLEFPDAKRPGYIGPRAPLYAAPASNLSDWTFLGALWEPRANESLGDPDITGSWGYNFEVSSFFGLDLPSSSSSSSAAGEKAWFLGVGTEGGNTTRHWREQWALWNRGEVQRRDNGSVEFVPVAGGALDWGIAYAQATWDDTKADRRVMWGWANEDILGEAHFEVSKLFGYQGSMTFPTEVFVKETKGVRNCGQEDKDGNTCVLGDDGEAVAAQTLGIRPLSDALKLLRSGSQCSALEVRRLSPGQDEKVVEDLGLAFELTATLSSWTGKTGIVVAQSPGDEEYTTIFFDPDTHTIGIDREHSSQLPQFNSRLFEGHFEPYVLAAAEGEEEAEEDLTFHVLLDGSLLEVWVNERFAMTAQIYPSRNDSTGLSFFAEGGAGGCGTPGAVWEDVKVWTGLADAWPERPADSSVPLRWDSPEESGNYTWWAGY